MSFNGPFKGWESKVKDRDDLLESLAKVAYYASGQLVGSPLDIKDFNTLPHVQRERLKNVLYAAFENLCRNICDVGEQGKDRISFHLVYDLSEEYSEGMLKLFHRIRRESQHYRHTIQSISFADDEISSGLQAADIVAYCLRQRHMDTEAYRTGIVRRLCEILFPKDFNVRYINYGPGAGLGDGKLDPKNQQLEPPNP